MARLEYTLTEVTAEGHDPATMVQLVGSVDPDTLATRLEHAGFREGAARLFGGGIVEPFSLYANITWQLPFDQGAGHTDVPEFRGIDRTRYSTSLLTVMGHSRLFEAERIAIATAVAWFYAGEDGGFTYWPDGPDAPPRVHEGRIFNTAMQADNERMFHRVRPVGARERGLPRGLTLDTRLEHRGGDAWAVVDPAADAPIGEPGWDALRVSVSWKARVFPDAEARRLYRDHSADLTLDEVVRRFEADLGRRGVPFTRPADPTNDPVFMDVLAATYVRTPTVYEPVAA